MQRDIATILELKDFGPRRPGDPGVGGGGIEQVAERPTLKELADRLASRTPVHYKVSPAQILREERSRR